MKVDLVVCGTGSLATAFCYALSVLTKSRLKVMILTRPTQIKHAEQLVAVCNARSRICENPIVFYADKIDWANHQALKIKLSQLRPEIIYNTASLQSPWEFAASLSEWSELVGRCGFAITTPLQACIVAKIAKALKELHLNTKLVNACYPDLVNPLLKSLGYPITCGIGNIGILHACINQKYSKSSPGELRILAHHYHIHEIAHLKNKCSLRAWIAEKELETCADFFTDIKKINGEALNQITAMTAVKICQALLEQTSVVRMHVPGPNGLPGGYPVTINMHGVHLDLPTSISAAEAIEENKKFSQQDGAVLENDGFVKFTDHAKTILNRLKFKYANGFSIDELTSACNAVCELREKLRN